MNGLGICSFRCVVFAKHGAKEYGVGIFLKYFTSHGFGMNDDVDIIEAGFNRACDGVAVGMCE